jgi:hypothetical protein
MTYIQFLYDVILTGVAVVVVVAAAGFMASAIVAVIYDHWLTVLERRDTL